MGVGQELIGIWAQHLLNILEARSSHFRFNQTLIQQCPMRLTLITQKLSYLHQTRVCGAHTTQLQQ